MVSSSVPASVDCSKKTVNSNHTYCAWDWPVFQGILTLNLIFKSLKSKCQVCRDCRVDKSYMYVSEVHSPQCHRYVGQYCNAVFTSRLHGLSLSIELFFQLINITQQMWWQLGRATDQWKIQFKNSMNQIQHGNTKKISRTNEWGSNTTCRWQWKKKWTTVTAVDALIRNVHRNTLEQQKY